MAFDSHRGKVVLFGGERDTIQKNDTWEWGFPERDRPVLEFQAALPTDLTPHQITGLNVRVYCGGRGYSQPGAELFGLRTDVLLPAIRWLSLGSNQADIYSNSPHLPEPSESLIEWTATSPDEAQAYVYHPMGKLLFQCRSRSTNGTAPAQVALDAIEVRVRYQTF